MAVWQYSCHIIPIRHGVSNLEYEEIISWRGVSCPQQEINFLDVKKSWSKDIIQYGDIDKTCIEFVFEDNELIEIECRIDLRNFSKSIFMEILNYVKMINAVFECDGQLCLPKEKDMINLIINSKAYAFCNNPIAYLDSIS